MAAGAHMLGPDRCVRLKALSRQLQPNKQQAAVPQEDEPLARQVSALALLMWQAPACRARSR